MSTCREVSCVEEVAARVPFNQSCRGVTRIQPGYRELVRVEEASTCLTAPIKSVRTTQITLSRSDFRSAGSSKGDVGRGGSVRLFSSNQLTPNQAHSDRKESTCREVTCGRLRRRKRTCVEVASCSRFRTQRRHSNQSCREVTCALPGRQKYTCVEEAAACVPDFIRKVIRVQPWCKKVT